MNKNLLKALGPGILFASTCIGVSHLVQSTSAGAMYGFGLLWAVLLANLFKYPFFEYGSRYANVTGTSIIDGYKKLGTWVLCIYALVTICSMFFVIAAVGAVTAAFLNNLFSLGISAFTTSCIAFGISVVILALGKYKVLDSLIKVIGAVLLASTLLAFFLTMGKGPVEPVEDFIPLETWTPGYISFLIALMGWMPTALDLSTWNSLWTVERMEQTGYKPKLKETLFDFNFGYIISALLAVCFVTLGAYVMHGSGKPLEKEPAQFANQVVEIYTDSIGDWSYFIIATAAFAIMFGTCIAVLDGYGRAMGRTTDLLSKKENKRRNYLIWLVIGAIGGLIPIYYYLVHIAQTADIETAKAGFKQLVIIATVISFVIAPLVAIANLILVGKKHLGDNSPPVWMKILSYLGIIFLLGFTVFYFVGPILLA